MHWYDPLRAFVSKGRLADRPGSLAGLAAARERHQGQFFTPDAVSRFMWRIVEPLLHKGASRKLAILDNSVGSGRLLQFAEPARHTLYGLDVDAEVIAAIGATAGDAGFECEFEAAGMETAHPRNMDVALINPPFSLHLEAPTLHPFPCTSYGKFGPNSSATSHSYALAQALRAAGTVVALLPASYAQAVSRDPKAELEPWEARRLCARFDLPNGSFREEGTEVAVSVLVFRTEPATVCTHIVLKSLDDPIPELGLTDQYVGAAHLGVVGVEDDGPAIRLPVTGDAVVRVTHDGRRISLGFSCGLVQAKVMNRVLRSHVDAERPDGHRSPKGVKYLGQGQLDLEVYLAQPDPMAAFYGFLRIIEEAGGKPQVAPGLLEHLDQRLRRHQRQATPMRHTVWMKSGVAAAVSQLMARAKRNHVANPKVWGSPLIPAGTELKFELAANGHYTYRWRDTDLFLTAEELHDRFAVTQGAEEVGWKVVHEGLLVRFPEVATAWRARATSLGIDRWLTWSFQFEDLLEAMLKPRGAVVAWDMGLGKARLSAALILLSGAKHGLLTVEAGLLEEMERELCGLPLSHEDWQVIREPSDVMRLRRINVISYERLRMELAVRETGPLFEETPPRAGEVRMHRTYAGALRRRCGLVVSDEGDLLANPASQQSRALWQLSAKRRFVLSGSPIANYPRDVLPVLAYAAGDGTAAQPYGWYGGYLEPVWLASMSHAARGIEAFQDRFVSMVWVTREFEETLLSGAKREIPRIGDLAGYRAMLAPHVKRRVTGEPEVEAAVKMPKPNRRTTVLQWDEAHLAYFLRIAEEFRDWYLDRDSGSGRRNNLIALLARIRAISFAQDFPQHAVDGFGAYSPLTSKQRYLVDRTEELVAEGHKVMLYVENPGLLELLGQHLKPRGVASTLFHGEIPPRRRMKAFDSEFRFGPRPVALMSYGCGQKGLNVPQADYVLFGARSWSATEEEQSLRRPCRPQQTREVWGEYVHLDGGIDVYKDQLVAFKRDAANAGLDWGDPETDDLDFLSLDTVIGRFCEDLAKLKGLQRHQLRAALAA